MNFLRFFRLIYTTCFYIPSSGKTFYAKFEAETLRPATRLRVYRKGRFF